VATLDFKQLLLNWACLACLRLQLSQLSAQQACVAAEVWALEGLVGRVVEASQAEAGGPVAFLSASTSLLKECEQLSQKVCAWHSIAQCSAASASCLLSLHNAMGSCMHHGICAAAANGALHFG
jgi:hypothetical protein